MMSGVARHRVRSFFFWRMISWPAAKGIRWGKPAGDAGAPSRTNLETPSFIGMPLWASRGSRSLRGDELEAVPDHAFLAVDPAELRADPHADPDVLRADVGHLADDLRPLVELDDRHRVRTARLLLLRELGRGAPRADQGERVDPAEALELDLLEVGGRQAAFAPPFGGEVDPPAGLAFVTDEPVPLGDRPPVHGDGNVGHLLTPPGNPPFFFFFFLYIYGSSLSLLLPPLSL